MTRTVSFLLGTATAMMALQSTGAAAQHILNVRDADIRAFIADAAKVTGRTFIVDGRVSGKVSVVTDRPLTRSEYFEVFLSTLRANGLVAVPTSSGAFRIQPAQGAATQPSRLGTAGASQNQFVTEVFRLKSIDATSAVETLRPLVSQEGSVTANRAGNSIVVADFADNVRRIRALIQQIDKDNAATQLIPLEHAGAREIAQALTTLIPTAGGEGGSLATVAPVDSSNAVVMRGDPATIARLAAVATDLDSRAANGSEIQVLWLDYADATQLVPMLERLVGGSSTGGGASVATAPAGPGATGGGESSASIGGTAITLPNNRGTAVITRYEGANAIIISAPVDVQRRLTELVRQLDVRQDQVLVEAIIVEISDNVAKELGVQFLLAGKDIPFGVSNFSNISPNILDLAGGLLADSLDETTTVINGDTVTTSSNSAISDTLRENAASAVLGARGGYSGFATDIGNNRVLGAIINAVQADSSSNILSTPHITTNNNIPASILFGQEIPVSTGEALSNNFDNAFRTIQRQNVGIELEVVPQIIAGDEVRLDLRQEVSSIVGPVSDDFNELIINKREIQTTLTVASGEIAVLGGLLDDNERRTIQRIPLLSDIPIIGELFKSRGRTRVKTNLMVFIRPTILRGRADRAALTARRYSNIREAQRAYNPKVEPSIDQLVVDYMGATLPAPPPVTANENPDVITPASPGTGMVYGPDGRTPAPSGIEDVPLPPSAAPDSGQ